MVGMNRNDMWKEIVNGKVYLMILVLEYNPNGMFKRIVTATMKEEKSLQSIKVLYSRSLNKKGLSSRFPRKIFGREQKSIGIQSKQQSNWPIIITVQDTTATSKLKIVLCLKVN